MEEELEVGRLGLFFSKSLTNLSRDCSTEAFPRIRKLQDIEVEWIYMVGAAKLLYNWIRSLMAIESTGF